MTMTSYQLSQARQWLKELSDLSSWDMNKVDDYKIHKAIDKFYDGGLRAFIDTFIDEE